MYKIRSSRLNEVSVKWRISKMATVEAFNKILNHQEQLKDQAQLAYRQALNDFEKSAEKLLLLLQKKEQVEKEYYYYLSSSGTVTTLATHYAFIEQIKERIHYVQIEVNQKRAVMEKKRDLLTEAHIEVKKFEKIIEKKHQKVQEKEKYLENQTMDEISTRQYFNHENR